MQVRWGARYPKLAGQGWRWFTSVLVHSSWLHVASNTFMFIALATYIETKQGWWRSARAPRISFVCMQVHARFALLNQSMRI